MMDREDMVNYIGQKKDPKVLDIFRALKVKAVALAENIQKMENLVDVHPKGYKPTEADHGALEVIGDKIFRDIAAMTIDIDLLHLADEGNGHQLELIEQEVLCQQFLEARKIVKPEKTKHDCGKCPINGVCPAAHGEDDNCVVN